MRTQIVTIVTLLKVLSLSRLQGSGCCFAQPDCRSRRRAAVAAFAQGTPQQRAACRPDVTKFCKGKGEDPGVLLTCLEDNKDKISEKCRKVIEAEVSGRAPRAARLICT